MKQINKGNILMMTYITKDDTKISHSSFAHFELGGIHYVACHDIFAHTGVQRIPWDLFYSKMKNNNAQWLVPANATQARDVFLANREEFLRYISFYDLEETKVQEYISQPEKTRDRSLIDVESQRLRKGMQSWR